MWEVECMWKQEREREKEWSKNSGLPKENLKIDMQCNHNVFILMNENAILLYFIKTQMGRTNFLQGPCAAFHHRPLKDLNTNKIRKQHRKLVFLPEELPFINIAWQHTGWSIEEEPALTITKIEDDKIFFSIVKYTWYWPSSSWLLLFNYPWPISFSSSNLAKLTLERWPLSEGFTLKPVACKLKAFKQSPGTPSQQILRQR